MRAFLIVVIASVTLAAQTAGPQVTSQDQLDGLKDPTRWLTNGGDYNGHRHSPLTQITPENVNQLAAQWTFQTGTLGSFQTTPIVIDGVLYVTGFNNNAWAIDARSGRTIWRYRRDLPEDWRGCCGAVNRGFGVLGDRLFMTTIDAHLVALDMRTGGVLFDVELADYKLGYSATVAPLIVKDKVILGIAGAEYGIRGFIDAYDAQTGKRAWRFHTVAGPGDPGARTWPQGDAYLRGGGSIWVTGTYDPQQNLIFFGTGNPGPDYYSSAREGDNLYTTSLVAIDADTGERRWHYQFTPHDVHDWDSTQVPVLADLTINGQPRKVVSVRQPQRVLLHDRSRDREGDRRQAVRGERLGGEIGPDGRPAAAEAICRMKTARRPVPTSGAARTSCRPPTIRPRGCSSSRRGKPARRITASIRSSSRVSSTPAARPYGRGSRRTSERCARSIR
jgi:alcohol dehydrogenase (cytochrome c)